MPGTLTPTKPMTAAPPRSRARPSAERPDLPALERVTVRTWGSVIALGVMVGVTLLLVVGAGYGFGLAGLIAGGGPTPQFMAALGLGAAGLAAMFGWLGARLVRGGFAWSTDPEGIEARGLFHRRHLRWTEIREIHSPVNLLEGCPRWFRLRGPSGEITLSPEVGINGGGVGLVGSVWQHLRRADRHREMQLVPEVESLWDDLPSRAADRIWENPYPHPGNKHMGAWFAMGLLPTACLASVFMERPPLAGLIAMLALTSAFAAFTVWMARSERRKLGRWVSRCELDGAGIHAETPLGPVSQPWGEIRLATWLPLSQGKPVFYLRGRRPGDELLFVLDEDRREATPVVFEIIRCLRHADPPHAVSLPAWLREPPALAAPSTAVDIEVTY